MNMSNEHFVNIQAATGCQNAQSAFVSTTANGCCDNAQAAYVLAKGCSDAAETGCYAQEQSCCNEPDTTVVGDQCEDGGLALAMSYVPWQRFGKLYNEKVALERGTAFPELDKPFMGRRVNR